MKYIARLTDSGPLSFRAGRETPNAETLPYVPGNALLGGLASSHTLLKPQDSGEFNSFFMTDDSSFGNLYPASFARPQSGELQGNIDPVYPLPATARSCKRFGGFKFDVDDPIDEPHHGVYDALILWALFSLSGQRRPEILESLKECHCTESLDRLDGFYRRNAFDAEKMGKAKVKLGLRTRTGINRASGTVQQGILYSRQILQATEFWGTLTVEDSQAESFKEFVEEANSKRLLRVGNNRTRGFGRIILNLEPESQTDTTQDITARLQSFGDELNRQAKKWNIALPPEYQFYLPLTLTSDAIIFDRLLRHRRSIDPEYLESIGIWGAKPIYQNSGLRRVMGWNDLWRLPKPDDLAITMGSVFLFGVTAPLNDELLRVLLNIQNNGLGARRREGFGRLVVASPFHWEVKGQ